MGQGEESPALNSIPRAFHPDDATLHKQKDHSFIAAKVRVTGWEADKEISTKMRSLKVGIFRGGTCYVKGIISLALGSYKMLESSREVPQGSLKNILVGLRTSN